MKEELSKPVTLVLYNPAAPAKISVDASAYGLGAVLLQKSESTWKPVTFASHSMTETERRYAQIEKEALATTWACEKFSDFVLGKHIMIETDHKPLVPLLGAKELDRLPPRILRFRLRMDRFSYDIIHVPGKNLYTADALSRAPMSCQNSIDSSLSDSQDLTELYVNDTISHLPASNHQLEIYKKSSVRRCSVQTDCAILSHRMAPQERPQPSIGKILGSSRQADLGNRLLMYGQRLVVPESLQAETLTKLHEGHQGIVRRWLRAKVSVWWPDLSRQLTQFIERC